MLDWNDLKHLLAVARSGSTLSAARKLGISQTTVARRIAAIEEALGLQIFDRRPSGYVLTAGGRDLMPLAEKVEQAALEVELLGGVMRRGASGAVRITAEEIFSTALLAPHLLELRETWPDIRIEIDNTVGVRDLASGEADIALRSTAEPRGAGLAGRRIARDEWTLYCSVAYAERRGVPRSIEDLKDHVIVGGGGGQLAREYGAWIKAAGLSDRVTIEQGSATGLLSAVRTGLGVAALPCIVADGLSDLIRCAQPPEEKRFLWLLTHERVRHQPAVRTVIDFLYERLTAHVRGLEHRCAA